ncbi:MAG: response regulator [Clostridia bacterium]|nr:response regulator [Clostridia bacterium]
MKLVYKIKGVSLIIKILICDDSITIRKKLQGAIKLDQTIEFYEAKNGVEAIVEYETHRPNIVFMDIIMPEKDGIEALKGIIAIDENAKVIMLSSVGTKSNLKVALENGASDFIQKPWDVHNLNTIIRKYI